jgi:hypothetical protein
MLNKTETQDWLDYLEEFNTTVYLPIFKPKGFTFAEAFLAWQLNRINNNVSSLNDDDDNWRS